MVVKNLLQVEIVCTGYHISLRFIWKTIVTVTMEFCGKLRGFPFGIKVCDRSERIFAEGKPCSVVTMCVLWQLASPCYVASLSASRAQPPLIYVGR